MKRDGACKSLWQNGMPAYEIKNKSTAKQLYDVIIIGGGITGISTGLLLQKSGKKCLVIEAHNLGFGTTGGTTAHINTFFDTPYSQIKKNFGEDNARLAATGAAEAINLIKKNIEEYTIDCEFKELPGYLFSLDDKQTKELEDVVQSANEVGVQVNFTNNSPLPIPYIKIAHFENQAQFHPIKYLYGIANAFEENGGMIVQHCRALNMEESGDELKIITSKGDFFSKQIIYATHIPPGVNLLHFRCTPWRSYAMAVKLPDNKYPDATAYDMADPYHYYRTQEIDGENFFIAGGKDHKTAHEENTEDCLRKLESYVRGYFDVQEVVSKWSSQYFEPADGIAYIGHLPGSPENVFVASGFGGNGMMYSQISALLLHDLIVSGKSKYEKLYDPNRIKPVAGFSGFVSEAADVVSHLIGGLFPAEKIKELSELAHEEARIVKYEDKTLGLYKDKIGNIHAVNPACTHIKCTVKWNNAEQSWDCPCHGSRFNCDGEVLTGPARKNLEKINLEYLK